MNFYETNKQDNGKATCCGGDIVKGNQHTEQSLPVAIIGGGPVGLAAAAHLSLRGESFVIFEAGAAVGSNILKWGHVRLFSPWQYNVDKAARKLLESNGWKAPDDAGLPTGQQLVETYLAPLAEIPEIKNHIWYHSNVKAISRKGLSKIKTSGRDELPFSVYVEIDGEPKQFEARAIIDATGTWDHPNPSLSDGVWTESEKSNAAHFFYGIPDILGSHKQRYVGKHVLVVGGGHSAINTLLELQVLKIEEPRTHITWVMRKQSVTEAYGGQDNDSLPARGDLGTRIQKMVDEGFVDVVTPFHIRNFELENGQINVIGAGKADKIVGVDEIISNTGSRPDFAFLRELRINIDAAIESVVELAPLIDPNEHSCGTVRPHGEKELRQPEKNLYIVGVKSYGRAPTFLLATGYEQVRSVVAGLTGDWVAARSVELDLPETGVCSLQITSTCCEEKPSNESSCCATEIK
ncbi:NAD(P)-binding domain-containing protein [Paenibacillus sp. FSL H7-0331]|uniref:NAD(P)-binding domain-containing protein n=1 Tax=Paenibacillus sp. FSL H7-0331 TaxID=1920421 RepID=UPI0009FA2522|nr:NAD(P)-binding domain-containing protein [Paenibacillus sp. FSL H7-0331]